MSNILNEIKLLLIYNEITLADLVKTLNDKYDRKEAASNFHRKLSKETIRYHDIKEIAETLGYRLAWIPNDIDLKPEHGIFFSTEPTRHKISKKEFHPSQPMSPVKIQRWREAQKRDK